jgi:hydrogenase nickel incorporation protein HypA/HybF
VHELGIATAILDRVRLEAERQAGAHFTKVGVRVGELSGVNPEALAFAFEVLVKDSDFEDLALEIDFRRRVQRCNACSREFATDATFTTCPQCGGEHTTLIGGDELDIVFIELEDAVCA